MKLTEVYQRPDWLRVKLPIGKRYEAVRNIVDKYKLHTICTSGNCPNMGECWGSNNSQINPTFLINNVTIQAGHTQTMALTVMQWEMGYSIKSIVVRKLLTANIPSTIDRSTHIEVPVNPVLW